MSQGTGGNCPSSFKNMGKIRMLGQRQKIFEQNQNFWLAKNLIGRNEVICAPKRLRFEVKPSALTITTNSVQKLKNQRQIDSENFF